MLEHAKKMQAQFVTNKVTHQNLFKKKKVTIQSPNNINESIVNSYLDKQHNTSTNNTKASAELEDFTDLHIDDNDDNQPSSKTDSKGAVQLQHYIITHYSSTKTIKIYKKFACCI